MKTTLKTCLEDGIKQGVYPSAELLIASKGKIKSHICAGDITISSERYFDLASLTKPLATALLCMHFFDEDKLHPDQLVSEFFPQTVLKAVTLAELLSHTSGLKDWHDFATPLLKKSKKQNFSKNKASILTSILQDKSFLLSQNDTVYSDLGFIILGEVLEKIGKQSLDKLFQNKIAKPLKLQKEIFYIPLNKPSKPSPKFFAPSEICSKRNKIIQGEVMDENAWVMGGVCGHAGLFGTAQAIHVILTELNKAKAGKSKLFSLKAFEKFCQPDRKRPWSKRLFTLGFDTPTKPHSQSGQYFSKATIGHLGYAGTSFWWDLEKKMWIILLTNRCMPSRENKKLSELRPLLHDLILKP